ncbi:DAK2 domain-containing protein [Salmonella enterica]|nr:DAK2 domain-containing protein [Salmonella enterica]EDB9445761.1 DAK2 domain-containing protein [Salmonella enterica subsp. enterica serovar Enteritidis]EBI5032903.1 Dak phosphatase [Salmonella enterica]EBN2823439.1 Dak phosphatase [Salmonella enterica]ECU1627111.1 Dak phosphatase [Salmonella enterica]
MKTELTLNDTSGLIAAWSAEMSLKRDELIKLDQAVGDGDLGITMQKAFHAAQQIQPEQEKGIAHYLIQCGFAMARAAPSTMGTLMATGFMCGGKALSPGLMTLGAPELATFFCGFTQGIAERGKARPGDKTVLDVLLPASDALMQETAAGAPLGRAAEAAKAAAMAGLEATRAMFPRHGKAAVFADSSAGKEDPGATVALIIFSVLSRYVKQ